MGDLPFASTYKKDTRWRIVFNITDVTRSKSIFMLTTTGGYNLCQYDGNFRRCCKYGRECFDPTCGYVHDRSIDDRYTKDDILNVLRKAPDTIDLSTIYPPPMFSKKLATNVDPRDIYRWIRSKSDAYYEVIYHDNTAIVEERSSSNSSHGREKRRREEPIEEAVAETTTAVEDTTQPTPATEDPLNLDSIVSIIEKKLVELKVLSIYVSYLNRMIEAVDPIDKVGCSKLIELQITLNSLICSYDEIAPIYRSTKESIRFPIQESRILRVNSISKLKATPDMYLMPIYTSVVGDTFTFSESHMLISTTLLETPQFSKYRKEIDFILDAILSVIVKIIPLSDMYVLKDKLCLRNSTTYQTFEENLLLFWQHAMKVRKCIYQLDMRAKYIS